MATNKSQLFFFPWENLSLKGLPLYSRRSRFEHNLFGVTSHLLVLPQLARYCGHFTVLAGENMDRSIRRHEDRLEGEESMYLSWVYIYMGVLELFG